MSLFITLALLAAAPAAGEDPDSIIVTGIPDAKREERKRAAEFVRRAGVAQLEPVARWIAPVCPRTLGVAAKIAGIVDDRIREVATAAGAPVAPTPCTPNIAVIFTDNGDGLTRAILDKSPRLAASLSSTERERLVQGDGPIRWWYGTRDESRDGMPTTDGILKQYNSSIVSTQVVRALRSATSRSIARCRAKIWRCCAESTACHPTAKPISTGADWSEPSAKARNDGQPLFASA